MAKEPLNEPSVSKTHFTIDHGIPMATPRRTRSNRKTRQTRSAARKSAMILGKTNYIILGASVAAILLGYTIMRVENEVDGFISLYVSPLILIAGYIGVIVAILWRSSSTEPTAPVNRAGSADAPA